LTSAIVSAQKQDPCQYGTLSLNINPEYLILFHKRT
jgi:hypothetical protein